MHYHNWGNLEKTLQITPGASKSSPGLTPMGEENEIIDHKDGCALSADLSIGRCHRLARCALSTDLSIGRCHILARKSDEIPCFRDEFFFIMRLSK